MNWLADPPGGLFLAYHRLDLGRVGITPDPFLLSTSTARDIATRLAWHENKASGPI